MEKRGSLFVNWLNFSYFYMRVHVISKSSLRDFVLIHSQALSSVADWSDKIRFARWNKPSDIIHTFPKADILGRGSARMVFNLGGNEFRLICQYVFGESEVHLYVCWIGKHEEYTRLCQQNKQYSINRY
ncbi:MAG: type II toxin-antitoxin system HigB family toxin [Chitinophagaceae bacterium]|nr:MAG: type II toxin-antitoxin system HigB family toxin [Chitinophagaceae bacterium]